MEYYNIRNDFLVFSSAINDKKLEEIAKFHKLIENSGVCGLIEKHFYRDVEKGGRPNYNPYDLFATIVYGFTFGSGSLRTIEDLCGYDLRFLYLMQNKKPNFKTIGNFINEFIKPNRDEIFSLMTKEIFKECNLEMNNAFIDGSKFEADCNKYKFVWKPTEYHNRNDKKIRELLTLEGLDRGVPKDVLLESSFIAIKLQELNEKYKGYDLKLKENKSIKETINNMVHYLEKSIEYETKERICGPNRNSYYKTDHDATAMCLKEDYYSGLGSNNHAAYNVQLCTISGLITVYYISQARNDLKELIPTLDKFYKNYQTYPVTVCADAGYGSLENYEYLEKNNIKNFVKYQTWNKNVDGTGPTFYRLNDDDTITCLNGNIGKIYIDPNLHNRKSNSTFYKVTGCKKCDFRLYCKRYMSEKNKKENYKIFEVITKLQKLIQQGEENLLSVEGIEMRVNRSIMVEGTFGIIKQDLSYDRFRRINFDRVEVEFMLVSLGFNMRKFFRYASKKESYTWWTAPEGTEPEKFKKPSAKRLSKKASKIKKKSVNQVAKDEYKKKRKRAA